MSDATLDLLFWIGLFVALGVGIRWLQKRKTNKD